ncbi:type I DNA topoisomerase (plasmid) [Deinococcus sp. KNUC1210]|uniref:type I DNA topoisomerase n=1 Tax=Deinococcus sp. KNUC1210 TaxID=2917691 RepID=UPI001EF1473E|nr:type I DNA topoisomerase [Deinococcus sp. KNUC1210]ULH17509.1 type I DNA topoisomerase [Deinococcus sp. KNUC1210]
MIVESPAKAKKIASYLGSGYTVQASLGHVRDLPNRKEDLPERYRQEPWANLGVNPTTFQPIYVVPESKERTVSGLRALAAKADRVILASDDDREGESISWHLSQLLELNNPQRMVFHEITKEALQDALKNLRPLDLNLVAAQEARRVIDRLVGYQVSPLLWNTVGKGLSAGRVQSAALMLLAQRESARMRFKPAAYWLIRAEVGSKPPFLATVIQLRTKDRPDGQTLAKASDFTQDGVLKDGADVLVMTDGQAKTLHAYLDGRAATVLSVETSETRSRPQPPFITSTLQQAGGRLRFGAKQVMDLAQKLYEGGYITYMRTDSPSLSDEALQEARKEAVRLFGAAAVPAQPRQYATRNQSAQEAHEAIRPAGKAWRPPDTTDLKGDELALYTLVYQRTVASQMHDAVYDKTVILLSCGAATLMAQGRVLKSAGYTQLLADEDEEKDTQRLPALQVGQTYPLKMRPLEGKKTSAPSRYTEATLVQAMEKAGIGRPSTYAQTLATLQTRDYARLEGRALAVTATGLLVAAYLARQLPQVTAQGFTAEMEAGLDAVASGALSRLDYLNRFWTQGLHGVIQHAQRDAPRLSLPHLEGTVLQAHRDGAQLQRQGQRTVFPAQVIPADLTAAVADQILAGTWTAGKPAKRASKPRAQDDSKSPPKRKPRAAGSKPPNTASQPAASKPATRRKKPA